MTIHFSPEGLKRDLRRALIGVLLFAGIVIAVQGCSLFNGPTPTNPQEALEHAYTTEIVGCAALAGAPGPYDRAEDLRCRAKVDCRYKLGPCPDGGE